MPSSPSASLLLVFSFHRVPLHLTLTFSQLIPCLLSHSSCQANKRLFAFPWQLMPRPGRERDRGERDRVLGGWREASGLGLPEGQDRCLLAGARKKLWLAEQMESSEKCDHKARLCVPTPPRASNPKATISTVLSMLCVSVWAVTPVTQQDMPQTHWEIVLSL